jgi:two-component system, LytTR family, response regulator LytT
MLKAYIVDDEPLARDELKYLLIRSGKVEILGESDSMDEAVASISELKPDLVFLDIELAEDNGLTIARQLETLEPAPAIVFATAYDEYALQAFNLSAVDYILKPFDEERIQKTLGKIKSMQKLGNKHAPFPSSINPQRNGKLAVMCDERIVLLTIADIVYIESNEGKCNIVTLSQTYKTADSLVVLEKKLQVAKFLRVHRSFIVNLDHIIEIEPWFNSTYNLFLQDGSKVPVSRTYIKELKHLLGI